MTGGCCCSVGRIGSRVGPYGEYLGPQNGKGGGEEGQTERIGIDRISDIRAGSELKEDT